MLEKEPGQEIPETENNTDLAISRKEPFDLSEKEVNQIDNFFSVIRKGNIEAVTQMIEQGMNVNLYIIPRGRPPQDLKAPSAHWTAAWLAGQWPLGEARDPEMAKFLIEKGAQINPPIKKTDQWQYVPNPELEFNSPLGQIVGTYFYYRRSELDWLNKERESLAEAEKNKGHLLPSGYNIGDSYLKDAEKAKKRAEEAGIEKTNCVETTKLLLEKGAIVTLRAMEMAVVTGDFDFLKALLEHGGKEILANETNMLYWTISSGHFNGEEPIDDPLAIAVNMGNFEAVRLLVENGAPLYYANGYFHLPGYPEFRLPTLNQLVQPRFFWSFFHMKPEIKEYLEEQMKNRREEQLKRFERFLRLPKDR